MIRINVELLQGGEVLAQDVTRDDGVVLMGAGAEMSEAAIRLLTRLEIEAVVVEGDLFGSEEEREEFIAEQEAELDYRFSKVTGDKVMMAIREMLRRRLQAGCILGAAAPGADDDDEYEYVYVDDDEDEDGEYEYVEEDK